MFCTGAITVTKLFVLQSHIKATTIFRR